jgi:5-methylcytosine-specific restriction endonuclease McrA
MKNKEKEIKLNELKKCIKCCSLKDVNDFHNNKTRKDGKQKYCKLCCKSSFENNKSKYQATKKQYTLNNKENHRKWRKKSWINSTNTPEKRLKHNIRRYIQSHLKNNKTQSTLEYLGCSIQEYIVYLEQQFTIKMNWENYGTYWEIDHIVPTSLGGSFHYSNTQPLTITENRKKSNKLFNYKI